MIAGPACAARRGGFDLLGWSGAALSCLRNSGWAAFNRTFVSLERAGGELVR